MNRDGVVPRRTGATSIFQSIHGTRYGQTDQSASTGGASLTSFFSAFRLTVRFRSAFSGRFTCPILRLYPRNLSLMGFDCCNIGIPKPHFCAAKFSDNIWLNILKLVGQCPEQLAVIIFGRALKRRGRIFGFSASVGAILASDGASRSPGTG